MSTPAGQAPRGATRPQSVGPFVGLCVVIVVGALVAVLLLNTTMAEGAYRAKELRTELADLTETRGELLTALDANAAPQRLAERALQLGMVPATAVGFIDLANGTVTGPGGTG